MFSAEITKCLRKLQKKKQIREKFKRNNDFFILRCIKDFFLLSHIHFYISILLATFQTGYLFEHYRAIYYGQSKPDNRSFIKHMKMSLQSNTWLNTTRTMLIEIPYLKPALHPICLFLTNFLTCKYVISYIVYVCI